MMFQNEIIGGMLIGIASAIPLLFEGRIAGVSGYAATAIRAKGSEGRSALIFVIGLVIGGLIWRISGGQIPNSADSHLSTLSWAAAGLLVGFGARLGGGCTSGHGVCGLGRMSPRSLASVILFIGVAMLTTYLMRSSSL